MSIYAVEESIASALSAGVCAGEIGNVLGRLSSWGCGYSVIRVKFRMSGRRECVGGVKVSSVEAIELRYVDGRWNIGCDFYRVCLGGGWVEGFELFCRRLGHPILLSRHGIVRDYGILCDALRAGGMGHCFPVRGCSASALCGNGAFPSDVRETASFLNVLGVTPAVIAGAASAVVED